MRGNTYTSTDQVLLEEISELNSSNIMGGGISVPLPPPSILTNNDPSLTGNGVVGCPHCDLNRVPSH